MEAIKEQLSGASRTPGSLLLDTGAAHMVERGTRIQETCSSSRRSILSLTAESLRASEQHLNYLPSSSHPALHAANVP